MPSRTPSGARARESESRWPEIEEGEGCQWALVPLAGESRPCSPWYPKHFWKKEISLFIKMIRLPSDPACSLDPAIVVDLGVPILVLLTRLFSTTGLRQIPEAF